MVSALTDGHVILEMGNVLNVMGPANVKCLIFFPGRVEIVILAVALESVRHAAGKG